MATRLLNEIRPTSLPAYCSACFGQDSSKRHVDFDAAADRGYGGDTDNPVPMDDLILCEDCIRAAAVLVGMSDTESSEKEWAELKRSEHDARMELHAATEYAEKLQRALTAKPRPRAAAAN